MDPKIGSAGSPQRLLLLWFGPRALQPWAVSASLCTSVSTQAQLNPPQFVTLPVMLLFP